MSRIAHYLDGLDPQWVEGIDLSDPEPVLQQVVLSWLDEDHGCTMDAQALALAERHVFEPWGEPDWREAVLVQSMDDVEHLLAAAFG